MKTRTLPKTALPPVLLDVVATYLDRSPDEITRDSTLAGDLGADDLDIVEICMELEHRSGVALDDDEAQEIFDEGTLGDIAALLQARGAKL